MAAKIYLFLAEGFEEVEAITPLDVLRRAGLDVYTVSISDQLEVTGKQKITVKADLQYEQVDFDNAQMLILPGGPGADRLNEHKYLKERLVEFAEKGKYIAAICAAPYIIGEMGLLKGHNATCFPGYEQRLQQATVTGNKVEVSGKFITAKGVGAAMDFSLAIVEQLIDKVTADELARRMQVLT
jgi:4-methyl-5(b-hydroxyethyl)-thiazole monophosphate biosynthesis